MVVTMDGLNSHTTAEEDADTNQVVLDVYLWSGCSGTISSKGHMRNHSFIGQT